MSADLVKSSNEVILRTKLQNAPARALNTLCRHLECNDLEVEAAAAKTILDMAVKLSAIEAGLPSGGYITNYHLPGSNAVRNGKVAIAEATSSRAPSRRTMALAEGVEYPED